MPNQMGQPIEPNGAVNTNGSQTPRDAELMKRIEAVERIASMASQNEVLQDADVARIIELKKQGVNVKIEAEEAEDASENLDSFFDTLLSGKDSGMGQEAESKETLDGRKITETIEAIISKKLDDALKPLAQRLQAQEAEREVQTVKSSIDDAVKLYGEDFSARKEKLIELHKQYPALSASDLYKIAAFDDIKANLDKSSKLLSRFSETERPGSLTFGNQVKTEKPDYSGKRGFEQLLQDSLSKRGF